MAAHITSPTFVPNKLKLNKKLASKWAIVSRQLVGV